MENLNLGIALMAGLLSFLSPCILPIAPAYLGIISGVSLSRLQAGATGELKRRVFKATLAFIGGFSLVFISLGLSSSFLGQTLRGNRELLTRLAGIIVILLGLHQAGWLPLKWLYREKRWQLQGLTGPWGAFVAGLAFSLGWTPCVGPVLGSILALAGSSDTLWQGAGLLAVYCVGLGLPFLILGLAFERVTGYLNRLKPYLKYFEWAAGLLLIVLGILLFFDQLSWLTF